MSETTARLPKLAAIYLPDEDDYGMAIYDENRGVWVLIEGRPIGDLGASRESDLMHVRWDRADG